MSTIFYNHTSSIPFSGGTASAPSITFAGDTDTGIYTGGTANTLRFTVGSSQKARLDVNGLAVYTGNLYIESGQKLNFDLNVSNDYYLQKSSTTLYMHSPVNLSLQTNGNHRLYINQTGQVGIGTTTPGAGLHVYDVNGAADFKLQRVTGYPSNMHFGFPSGLPSIRTSGNFAIKASDAWGADFYISSAGNVGIGTTAPSAPLSISNGGAEGIELNYNVGNEARILSYNRSNSTYRNLVLDSAYHRFKIFGNEVGSINGSGNVTFNNDLTVGGIITAQEFRTEFITQTVIFESGSTAFGNSDDDTHTFTGTLTVNTPSDNQIGNGVRINRPGNYYGGFEFAQNGSVDWSFGVNSSGFGIYENGAAATTRLNIKDGGNVGIGTTSPAYLLDVNGTAKVNTLRVHNSDPGIIFVDSAGSTYDGMFRYRDNYLEWLWGGGIKLRVSENGGIAISQDYAASTPPVKGLILPGNVGIGTDSPGYKLDVAGSNGNFGVGSTGNDLYFTRNGANYFYATGASSSFRFFTAGVEKLNLGNTNSYFPNGNVGIGTTAPAFKLDVSGSTRIQGADSNSTISDYGIFALENQQREGIGFGYDADGNTAWIYAREVGIGSRALNVNGSVFIANYGGNVGIGSSNPQYTLDVAGTIRVGSGGSIQPLLSRDSATGGLIVSSVGNSGDFIFQGSGGTEKFRITDNGNVGIGTASPTHQIHVESAGNAEIQTQRISGAGVLIQSQASVGVVGTNTNHRLDLKTNGGTRMTVTTAGSVGIGTTSPGAMLDVAGQASIDADLYIGADNGANYTASRLRLYSHDNYRGAGMHMTGVDSNWFIGTPYTDFAGSFIIARKGVATSEEDTAQLSNALFTIRSTGNVGIGTTSPSFPLDVNGSMRADSYRIGGGTVLSGLSTVYLGSGGATGAVSLVTTSGEGLTLNGSNVGIGTTSPARKLHIGGSGGSGGGIMLSPSSGDVEVQFQDSGTTNAYITLKDGTQQMRFRDDTANVLNVDFGTERVGINTTAPDSKLTIRDTSNVYVDIQGDGNVEAGIRMRYQNNSNAGSKIFYNTPNAVLYYDNLYTYSVGKVWGSHSFRNRDAAGTLQDRLYIAPLGNVGIGTTSPNSKLEVYGSGSTVLDIQGSQGQLFSVSDSLTGSLMSVNDISGLPILEVFDTDKVVMGEFGANALVVTGSNVGIGTDTPNRPLTIETNTTDVIGALKVKNAGTGDASMFFQVNASGNVWQLGIDNSDGDKFKIGQDNSNADVGVGTKLTIDTSGNVGIGTTSPAHDLHVNGDRLVFTQTGQTYTDGSTGLTGIGIRNTGTSGAYNAFGIQTGVGSIFQVRNDGQVRVGRGGTDDRDAYLIIDGASGGSGEAFLSLQRNSTQQFLLNTTNSETQVRNTGNLPIYFYTNDSIRMTVAANGNIGMGTTSPANKLSVLGNANITGFLTVGDSSADTFTSTGHTYLATLGNNVGIGTTSPAYKLDVNGDVRFIADEIYLSGPSVTRFRSNNEVLFLTNGGSAQNSKHNGIQVSSNYSGAVPTNGILFHTDNQLQRTAADQLTYSTTGGLGYLLPGANPGYFIGSDSRRWEIVFCNILDSAGLHEKNLENPQGEKQVGEYATGTVLVWKGGKNVPCTVEADHMRMGVAVEGMNSPLVQGAEPVLVTGIANEGDYLISSEKEGHARAISRQEMIERNLYDCVLGKALESGQGESYLLKVWITI